MKAVVFDAYGPPEVLHVGEVAKPAPKNDELLIRVHAAEATKADCEFRRSRFAVKWLWPTTRLFTGITKPRLRVLGWYFAGTIESVGSSVTRLQPGDEVFGCTKLRMGAYGEFVSLPESYSIVPKPANISFEEAAAVPLGGLNALHFMTLASIKPGGSVLINGAGGSIGSFAIMIAKTMGTEVTAVDRTEKQEMLRSLGADHVIDYTREDVTKSGKRFDVIMTMVAQSPYSGFVGMLKPGGRYLIVNPRLSDMVRSFITSRFSDKTATFAFAGEKPEELLQLKEMIEAGKIRPVLDRVFPMDQAAEAHHMVETEQRLGTIVIRIGDA
ncbi:NADPH:quinone reductase [Mariprofundus aestuarium]|uniref:NADPH:quinone reductase n=1 Tax=Mariprofundus aestuarium TaxID=1921086 RepID=A0A2K8KXG9_MARES|nr:NAD(P)-dependent alcohol dehydrogenase [Mariprofundus aestuarium]ATX79618.1 NADPH:quinone reductase [Mariprofundus aestuarium]